MKDKDKHNLKLVLSHCQLMESHVRYSWFSLGRYQKRCFELKHYIEKILNE